MSKGKNQAASRPLPESQDGATSNGPGLARPRTGSVNRLPSLRPKRDLTLGSTPTPKPLPKKTFTPTIPVRRKKHAVPSPSPSEDARVEGATKERGRERERRGRGRGGRGRRERDVITSASIFSMGPAERLMQKREMAGEMFRSYAHTEKSGDDRIKGKDSSTRDPNKYHLHFSDEERDREMEVDEKQLFSTSKLPPVQLPLDYSLHARHRTVAPKQIKVKKEVSDLGDTATPAPVKLVKPVLESTANQTQPKRTTAAQLFTPSEGSKGQFLFFQLPDCVPVREGTEDDAMDTTDTTTRTQPAASAGSKEEENAALQNLTALKHLPSGLIGKIRVHKSGKVKLVLGDNTLDVAMGTPCGFLQELVSVRTDQERAEMIVLGQMSHRLICTPDFQSLLDSERLASSYDSSEQLR